MRANSFGLVGLALVVALVGACTRHFPARYLRQIDGETVTVTTRGGTTRAQVENRRGKIALVANDRPIAPDTVERVVQRRPIMGALQGAILGAIVPLGTALALAATSPSEFEASHDRRVLVNYTLMIGVPIGLVAGGVFGAVRGQRDVYTRTAEEPVTIFVGAGTASAVLRF